MSSGQDRHGTGESSGAETSGPSANDDAREPSEGSGDLEIPIGVPVSEEEFRRLKEEARRHRRSAEEAESDEELGERDNDDG